MEDRTRRGGGSQSRAATRPTSTPGDTGHPDRSSGSASVGSPTAAIDSVDDNCAVGIEDERFPAYDNGMRWNGFVCPTFRHDIARQVTAYFNEINAAGPWPEEQEYFVWVGDTIVHIHGAYLHDPDYTPLLVGPNAQGRYAIGAMAWTWRRTD